jgi:hypothetical protein
MPDDKTTEVPAQPSTATRPALPGNVTAAAIILLVFGTLSALSSALALLWSLLFLGRMGMGFDRFGGEGFNGGFGGGFNGGFGGGAAGVGFLFFIVAVALAAAVAGGHLAAGWAVLQRLSWGRILGMVVAGAALAVLVLGMLGTLVWVAALPDLSQFDRVPDWFADWFRTMLTAGVGIGVLVSLVVSAAYGYVLWVLARADEVFD